MDTEIAPEIAAVETSAAPEAEIKTGEVEKAESTPATVDTPEKQPPKKTGGGFQKRIDRLTRQVYELTAQLQTKTPAAPSDKEPQRGEFEDLETYNRALATHIAKQTVKETLESEKKTQREASQRQDQAKRAETWESHVERVSDKYEDGDDVVANFLQGVELSHVALDAIIGSELCGELAYFLGKNEGEAERISKLIPARQASEIGKLEAKLASMPTKKASSAPAPIVPLTGKSGSDAGLSDELSTAEWIKRRSKQVRGR